MDLAQHDNPRGRLSDAELRARLREISVSDLTDEVRLENRTRYVAILASCCGVELEVVDVSAPLVLRVETLLAFRDEEDVVLERLARWCRGEAALDA